MGAVLAKFRKEKSTTEVLEGLEEEIQTIENYSTNTRYQKKRFVGNFLAISIGIYVVAFLVFYFVYFPPTWRERFVYSVPLLIFPLVILFLRKLFTTYFERKLNKNSKKLKSLRDEKKKILQEVMDKETYKVAVNLISRFGDKTSVIKPPAFTMTPRITTSAGSTSTAPNSPYNPSSYRSPISKRNTQQGITGSLRSLDTLSTQSTETARQAKSMTTLSTLSQSHPGGDGDGDVGSLSSRQLMLSPQSVRLGMELRKRTPFPIVSQQGKSVFERIVDVLVGDGPQDRFAMICKECFAHNGMALKEEYDYATFRCAFCNAMNPSRKARPIAPRLPQQPSTPGRISNKDSSDTSSSEDSDVEESERNRPVPILRFSGESNLINAIESEISESDKNPDGNNVNYSDNLAEADSAAEPEVTLTPNSIESLKMELKKTL